MVRAFAGDSTITRFFGTAGSVALGPAPPIDGGFARDCLRPRRVDQPLRLSQETRRSPRKSEAELREPIGLTFSDVADAAKEVLVQLQVALGLGRLGGGHSRGCGGRRFGVGRGCLDPCQRG